MTNLSAIAAHSARGLFRGRLASLAVCAMLAVVGTCTGTGAYAQGATPPEPNTGALGKKAATDAELLADFIHYTVIANYDLAAAKGQELLNRKLSNADFVKLVDSTQGGTTKFTDTAMRAMRNPTVAPVASALNKAYETGILERARNPDQITKNIQDLLGNARTKDLARRRLYEAGEYAMTQLVEKFLDRSNPQLQVEVQIVMRNMGRQAIIPLATAMMSVPPAQQEQIADLLGLIEYRTSLPYLSDLASTTKSDSVRSAALRAIDRLGGATGDCAALYRSLAEAYYNEKSELTSFPGEEHQLLWTYVPNAGGLIPTAIRTPVYHEARAMSLLERGMTVEQATGGVNPDSLALWISANFSREIDTPPNYINPAYPVAGAAPADAKPRRTAMYFAVAAGADIDQRVLARALDSKDTQLARRALAAAEQTAGGHNLWGDGTGRMPLLEAITYPNRRVQYEAALALAAAQPQMAFNGSDRVVPALASSIRGASTQYAAIVAIDAEVYQGMRRLLTGMGYTVLPQGRAISDLQEPIAEAPAVDLVVGAGLSADKVPALIEQVRGWTKISATPILVITNPESYVALRHRYDTDSTVAVRQSGVPNDAMTKAITDLVNTASGGPITDQEAREYAKRSLAALRDLAVSNNAVLNVSDAVLPLIGALADPGSASRMQIAEILARVGQERAQRAVVDAALTAKGADKVALLGLAADSAKRFGNLLEIRQVAQVVELASKGTDEEATAAAGLMGALKLEQSELVTLIVSKK